MYSIQVLVLFGLNIVSVVFSDVAAISELSGNVVEGTNIFKCKCGMNEAIGVDGECVPSSNPVPVWDQVRQKHFVADIGNFTSVSVNPVRCQAGYSKLTLTGSQFVIYTNGFLDNLMLIDDPPSLSYCIDQILEQSGISVVAEVCQVNPAVPLCCPVGHISNDQGDCLPYGDEVPLNFTMIGDFSWTEYTLTEQNIQCKEGEIIKRERITLPSQIGASLVSYPLGTKLQWISIYNHFPQIMSHDEYCVVATESTHGWRYYAQFCVPDPKLEHRKTCENSTCIRKCCPLGFILDTMYSTCVRHQTYLMQYEFIHPNDQVMEEHPTNITLVYGFPFCDEFHILSSDAMERNLLRFNSEGSLVTANSGNYSAMDYCVEGLVSNSLDPKSTVKSDAIICIKGFRDACQWRWIVSGVMLSISCLFYLLTFLVYLLVKKLRSKMVGKCLISQVSALFIAYFTLIFLQNVLWKHISLLGAFFWLNVLCYDMWSKIRKMKVVKDKTKSSSKKFLFYCLYAWGIPLLIALIRVIIDLLPEDYDSKFLVRSNIGKTHCFFSGNFSDSAAKWLYLYLPILILLLVNLFFFIHVAVIIRRTEKESAKFLVDSESSKTGKKNITGKKEKARLYLKLFIVMGISWLLEIIMWIAVPENDCYFWGLDIVNMLQGVLIFFIFVCKKKTLNLVKERFGIATQPVRPVIEEIGLNEQNKTANMESD